MYASREEPMVGDIVRGHGGEGEVLEITPKGVGGETATVRWTTPQPVGPGINRPLAPSTVSTQSLTLVRRKVVKVVGVRKADNENPPHFELQYLDLEKKQNEKGYFLTTKYGSETQLRELLKSGGVSDVEIDAYFRNAT